VCSGCGRRVSEIREVYEREVRDLACFEYQTSVVLELYRVRCPNCGVKAEKVEQLPSKAPFSKRFEEAVGQACESAAVRQVARQLALAASTVRAIDLRYLERWSAGRRKPSLRQRGVDEIYLGKKQKFMTVVSNLETVEPLWMGRERKKETLDEFFRTELSAKQRRAIAAVCTDMWKPYQLSLEEWAPQARLVYDKFHVLQHANAAIDEVRRVGFFRQGGRRRELVKGRRWLLPEPVGESGVRAEATTQPTLQPEPKSNEGLPAQREPGPAMELPLRRGDVEISPELDRSTSLATPEGIRETRPDVAESLGGDSELLPDQGAAGSSGGRERKYQGSAAAGSRLRQSALSTAEGTRHGRDEDRIHHRSKGRLKCGICQIPAQNR
jgi:Transposase/Helix-turn-helix domain of transposase family ISL3/zinc-finger of transposase IS204/IS1001/IS1096/IS1165